MSLPFFRLARQSIKTTGLRPSLYQTRCSSTVFAPLDTFARRHLGPTDAQEQSMLAAVKEKSINSFVKSVIPPQIFHNKTLKIPNSPLSETELLARCKEIASKNIVAKTYIGLGYYGTITPGVISRNILENPAWYTSYTPYQPEISQGRLESLLNFQTVVSSLTGLPFANASLLDEATAAAESISLAVSVSRTKKQKVVLVDANTFPQTLDLIVSRAQPLGVKIIITDLINQFPKEINPEEEVIASFVQYPAADGSIHEIRDIATKTKALNAKFIVASDLLALTILTPPGELGADICVGSAQRFGVPMGYGGPHAAFLSVADEFKRKLPGRLIGVSIDKYGHPAMRLTLQTREQHIRREKATSNICTAQALLANMSAMYAVYHGPEGLKKIAKKVSSITKLTAVFLESQGWEIGSKFYFDTLTISGDEGQVKGALQKAADNNVNIWQLSPTKLQISFDETTSREDLQTLFSIFTLSQSVDVNTFADDQPSFLDGIPDPLRRTSAFLQQDVFNSYHSESQLMRYIYHLQSKDLSLVHSMISLGSCTMKLNATTEMVPVTWPEFSNIHPFAPLEQAKGYAELINELEDDLANITGFDAVSLQPNSGAQGEYAGLRVIREFLLSTGNGHRDICLIPVSAHGTNPASAAMCGLKVVSLKCLDNGNLDMEDLKAKAALHKDNLAAIMVTYPSTFGVFEPEVKTACKIVHDFGGQVYMDGANMNAQIGLTSPGDLGADVCHLNLHKTFCIPHGGGGPGVGPIGVRSHLAPYLPGSDVIKASGGAKKIQSISAAPWGSASILPISWSYIKMMGGDGLTKATEIALLNANYMASKLAPHYKILYTNSEGRCAHEFIIDIRPFQKTAGIQAIDIAKRLQDYGFHAPTMSWPVTNTLMIEPTESEDLNELDRFCEALISIRGEIAEIEKGDQPRENNVLRNSPHPQYDLLRDEWDRPYSREKAAYPLLYLRERKFWPAVARLDDTYGDQNIFCACS